MTTTELTFDEKVAAARLVRAAETIQGLRELVSFLEKNPEFTPYGVYLTAHYCNDLPELADKASRFGSATKKANDYELTLNKDFGGSVILTLRMARDEACTRVEDGTEEVTEEVVIIPAVTETRTITRPKYHWECPPSILAHAES